MHTPGHGRCRWTVVSARSFPNCGVSDSVRTRAVIDDQLQTVAYQEFVRSF